MRKSLLAFVALCFAARSNAQNTHFLPQSSTGGASINIVASSLDENEGNAYFVEAERNERKGDLNEAVTMFGKAAFEYNSLKQLDHYGAALLRLSNAHYLLEHYSEAEQVVLNVAIKNYSKLGSKGGLIDSYSQLGKIYLAVNKYTQSMWFYTQQGILAKQIGNSSAYIDSVIGIAKVKIRKKEYSMAQKDLDRAEHLASGLNASQYKSKIREARALMPVKNLMKK
ncbi:tetratricopeptide (TPR) repeat protein [Pedobacter sp. UYP24]